MAVRRARTESQKRQARAEIKLRYGAAAQRRNPDFRLGELRRLFADRGLSRTQADAAIDDLDEYHAMSAEGLGKAINLTFDERVRLDIRTIRCCDRTLDDVEAYLREKKRARDRQASQNRRAKRRRMTAGAARAKAVRAILERRTMASVALLSDQLCEHPAFRGLDKAARKTAVHRAIIDIGAQTMKQMNETGFPTLYARLLA